MFAGKELAAAIVNRKLFIYRAVGCAEQLEASRGIVGFEMDDGLCLVVLHAISKAATKAAAAEGDIYRFKQVCLTRTIWSNDDGAARRQLGFEQIVRAKIIYLYPRNH